MAADESTQQQLAELREEIAAKRTQRHAVRRRLNILEEQAYAMGWETPPHVKSDIEDAKREKAQLDTLIAEFGRQVARLELAPTPGYILPPGEVLPQLAPAVIDTRLLALEHRLGRQDEAIERIERRQDDANEWRTAQERARVDGQSERLRHERLLLALLFVIALGVMLIVVRVY